MTHSIKAFNGFGKCMNEMHFANVNEAYAEYCGWMEKAEHLPKGYETTIVRYDESGYIMNLRTVIGRGEER